MVATKEFIVKVTPDLSAFRQASEDDLIKLLTSHVYGDARDDGSVCARIAAELLSRYTIIPR